MTDGKKSTDATSLKRCNAIEWLTGLHLLPIRMKVAFDLPPAQAERLQREAERLGLTPDALARAALADLLGTPDAEFREAATRILQKNQELYKRLA